MNPEAPVTKRFLLTDGSLMTKEGAPNIVESDHPLRQLEDFRFRIVVQCDTGSMGHDHEEILQALRRDTALSSM
jgi:hypothetical protein